MHDSIDKNRIGKLEEAVLLLISLAALILMVCYWS
jgi:hypothetical protein